MQLHKLRLDGQFCFDPDDPIYVDHFPGRPVVPGSLIVQAFISVLGGLPRAVDVAEVDNFRFKRFVGPGTYTYRLDRRLNNSGPSTWHCRLLDGGLVVVSGVLT